MNTLHMHTHMTEVINQNYKGIREQTSHLVIRVNNKWSMVMTAAKQRSNESGGWGIEQQW